MRFRKTAAAVVLGGLVAWGAPAVASAAPARHQSAEVAHRSNSPAVPELTGPYLIQSNAFTCSGEHCGMTSHGVNGLVKVNTTGTEYGIRSSKSSGGHTFQQWQVWGSGSPGLCLQEDLNGDNGNGSLIEGDCVGSSNSNYGRQLFWHGTGTIICPSVHIINLTSQKIAYVSSSSRNVLFEGSCSNAYGWIFDRV
jgi:hypothetical protein